MLTWENKTIEIKDIVSVTCDKCGKVITNDTIEMQELYSIHFVGGYGSVFGDGTEVSCDLCQRCLKELIGNYCKYGSNGPDDGE